MTRFLPAVALLVAALSTGCATRYAPPPGATTDARLRMTLDASGAIVEVAHLFVENDRPRCKGRALAMSESRGNPFVRSTGAAGVGVPANAPFSATLVAIGTPAHVGCRASLRLTLAPGADATLNVRFNAREYPVNVDRCQFELVDSTTGERLPLDELDC